MVQEPRSKSQRFHIVGFHQRLWKIPKIDDGPKIFVEAVVAHLWLARANPTELLGADWTSVEQMLECLGVKSKGAELPGRAVHR